MSLRSTAPSALNLELPGAGHVTRFAAPAECVVDFRTAIPAGRRVAQASRLLCLGETNSPPPCGDGPGVGRSPSQNRQASNR
jgi:hypothetical protein